MKKIVSLLFAVAVAIISTSTVLPTKQYDEVGKLASASVAPESLILNADGSYGGSINESLYGVGAPKNGEFNVSDSPYYMYNDFYNMNCTNDAYPLLLLPKFKSYQQTMKDSSAFACLVMIFNSLGFDVTDEYSELSLLNKYQTLFNTTVYNHGDDVTDENLGQFINSLNTGYECLAHEMDLSLGESSISKAINRNLKAGNYVLVRYQSANGFGWKVVIGYDAMGTEHISDDIIIFADPFDSYDHYQTGYSHVRFDTFAKWCKKVDVSCNVSNIGESVTIKAKNAPNFTYVERDTEVKQTLYDLHHILNADGSYGGTRDAGAYGVISTKNGNKNRTFTTYYKINDYYNLGTENSRILLKNYNNLQQTMAASCAICATISVFKHYGEPITEIDEVNFYNYYETVTGDSPNTRGSDTECLLQAVKAKGYEGEQSYTRKGEAPKFPKYEDFRSFVKENLSKDRPIVIDITPKGGHFVAIIGIDDMGTDYIYDDVIIIADSSDSWDHYQDGYNIYSATQFYRQFANESKTYLQQCLVIYKN